MHSYTTNPFSFFHTRKEEKTPYYQYSSPISSVCIIFYGLYSIHCIPNFLFYALYSMCYIKCIVLYASCPLVLYELYSYILFCELYGMNFILDLFIIVLTIGVDILFYGLCIVGLLSLVAELFELQGATS